MAEIAVACAIAVIKQATSTLGNLAVQEVSRLFKVKQEIDWMERWMGRIQAHLKDADANDQEGRSNLDADLMTNIRDIACDVEDIVETYFPKIASHNKKGCLGCLKSAFCCLCDCYAACNFVKEIEAIRGRILEIPTVKEVLGKNENHGSGETNIWDERRDFLHIQEPAIVGFDDDIVTLVAEVLNADSQHRVISIVGMPGLGKTTLAKRVFSSVTAVGHHFECSAKVYVSQMPNTEELLQDIAKQVGLEEDKCKQDVKINLSAHLSHKRYVIYLDDIWNTQTWDALKVAIPMNSENGSRIILTSRNTEVALYIGGNKFIHELQPLDPAYSWRLFSEMVMGPLEITKSTPDFQQFESLGEKIVERCGHVPLAIVDIAGLLLVRQRTPHAWEGVLTSMGHDEDKCSRVLALSYKDLPIELKPCFLYFGLFPKDYEIYAFDLINMWVAEGFIQEKGELTVEDVGEHYLNLLIARNLIQVGKMTFDGRIKICRIHDLLHSLCIRVAKESNFFNTHRDVSTGNSVVKVRRVTLHRSSLLEYVSSDYHTPKVRAILAFGSDDLSETRRKCYQNFFGGSMFLRVIRLECCGFPKSLSNEIGNLSHLRYFKLMSIGQSFDVKPLPTWIWIGPAKLIPTMSNLKNLLTLDIEGGLGTINPNVIWKMKQLRHILIYPTLGRSWLEPEEPNMKWLHRIQVSLPNLQTLYHINGERFEANGLRKFPSLRKLGIVDSTTQMIEELSSSTSVSDKLEKLRLAGIVGRTGCETLNLSRYVNLGRLHLRGRISELPSHDKLPPNLTKLTLQFTLLATDPMKTLRKLPKLKILKLMTNSYLEKKIVCSEGPDDFPQLEVLRIHNLPDLQEIALDGGGMPNLKKVLIKVCFNLRRIPEKFKTIIRESEDKEGARTLPLKRRILVNAYGSALPLKRDLDRQMLSRSDSCFLCHVKNLNFIQHSSHLGWK